MLKRTFLEPEPAQTRETLETEDRLSDECAKHGANRWSGSIHRPATSTRSLSSPRVLSRPAWLTLCELFRGHFPGVVVPRLPPLALCQRQQLAVTPHGAESGEVVKWSPCGIVYSFKTRRRPVAAALIWGTDSCDRRETGGSAYSAIRRRSGRPKVLQYQVTVAVAQRPLCASRACRTVGRAVFWVPLHQRQARPEDGGGKRWTSWCTCPASVLKRRPYTPTESTTLQRCGGQDEESRTSIVLSTMTSDFAAHPKLCAFLVNRISEI